jgi:antitoxin component HigA of HigAB toxin-antitoxin module
MNVTRPKFSDFPSDYAALVAMHPPRPLRDDIDEENVEEIVGEMAGHELSPDQEDYLDLLSDLLLKYQAKTQSQRRRKRSSHERLKYLISQSQTTPAQLAGLLGCSQPLVSLLLSGKRNLSKENVKKLAAHFKVDAVYFL